MARCENVALAVEGGSDGRFKAPASVPCLICGKDARCTLNNAYWLNQFSDDMGNQYSSLCSARCAARLDDVLLRMKVLVNG